MQNVRFSDTECSEGKKTDHVIIMEESVKGISNCRKQVNTILKEEIGLPNFESKEDIIDVMSRVENGKL